MNFCRQVASQNSPSHHVCLRLSFIIIFSPSVKINCPLSGLVTVLPDHAVKSPCRINEGHTTQDPSLPPNTKNYLSGKDSGFLVNPALSYYVCRAQEGCVRRWKEPGMKAVEYWRTSKLWAAVNWNSRDCDEQHLSMTDPRCLCFPTISKKKILIFNSHQLLKCYWCSHSGAPRIADGGLLFPRKPRALGEEHGQVLCSNLFGSVRRALSLRQS